MSDKKRQTDPQKVHMVKVNRMKREREWDAKRPGINFYCNPDLPQFIERIKVEDSGFREFLEKAKSDEEIKAEIRETIKTIELEFDNIM